MEGEATWIDRQSPKFIHRSTTTTLQQGKPAAAAPKAAAEHHQEEHPAAAVELLFDGAVLRDKAGNVVEDPMKALEGRAVGLLFGAMWWCVFSCVRCFFFR